MASSVSLLAALRDVAGGADLCTPVGDQSLVEFVAAHPLGDPVSATLRQHAALLRSLLNMGVRESRLQVELYNAVRADASAKSILDKIRAALETSFFLGGDAIGSTDVAVASTLFDLLSLGLPPSLVPSCCAEWASVARWFSSVCAHPVVAAALRGAKLASGGVVRVGGQVDLRAEPAHVAALADASVVLNAHHKKAPSQRDVEDASKGGAVEAAHSTSAAPVASASAGHASTSVAAVPVVASQPESNKSLPQKSSEDRIALTHKTLDSFGITYSTTRHAAANTLVDLQGALAGLPGTPCKNLFIKAKKEKAPGDSRMWLVIAAHDTKTDLVALATKLGYGKIVLRFGDAESLLENLGVVQGHVSPFCLANDAALQVNVALDSRILTPGAGPLYFHPQTNDASTAVSPEDLVKFLTATGHAHTVVEF